MVVVVRFESGREEEAATAGAARHEWFAEKKARFCYSRQQCKVMVVTRWGWMRACELQGSRLPELSRALLYGQSILLKLYPFSLPTVLCERASHVAVAVPGDATCQFRLHVALPAIVACRCQTEVGPRDAAEAAETAEEDGAARRARQNTIRPFAHRILAFGLPTDGAF